LQKRKVLSLERKSEEVTDNESGEYGKRLLDEVQTIGTKQTIFKDFFRYICQLNFKYCILASEKRCRRNLMTHPTVVSWTIKQVSAVSN